MATTWKGATQRVMRAGRGSNQMGSRWRSSSRTAFFHQVTPEVTFKAPETRNGPIHPAVTLAKRWEIMRLAVALKGIGNLEVGEWERHNRVGEHPLSFLCLARTVLGPRCYRAALHPATAAVSSAEPRSAVQSHAVQCRATQCSAERCTTLHHRARRCATVHPTAPRRTTTGHGVAHCSTVTVVQ